MTEEQRLSAAPSVVRDYERAEDAAEYAAAALRAVSALDAGGAGVSASAEPLFNAGDVRFTDEEKRELKRLGPDFFRDARRRASPRAIKALLFRIQLFRLLLQLCFPSAAPECFSIRGTLAAFTA